MPAVPNAPTGQPSNRVYASSRDDLELWKRIKGWRYYEVSSFGRVRSLDRVIVGADGKTYKFKGRMLALTPGKGGYPKVTLKADGRQKVRSVHQLVARAFLSNPDKLPLVMHLDDQPSNNHYRNLQWGTPTSNTADRDRKGRQAKGTTITLSKLKEADISAINQLYFATTLTQREIGNLYGVSDRAVSGIVNNKAWKHISRGENNYARSA